MSMTQLRDWIKDTHRPFLVIAHRGESQSFPENTMPAFHQAIESGAAMIELDVQLTLDEQIIVLHDSTLRRTTNGSGWVRRNSWNMLSQLDAGSWKSDFFTGTRIPLLEEVLEYSKGRIWLNIELKASKDAAWDRKLAQAVIALVDRHKQTPEVLFSCFSYQTVAFVKQLKPTAMTGLLYAKPYFGKVKDVHQLIECYQADTFHCATTEIQGSWLDMLHELNTPSLVYTVNDATRAMKLKNMGVHGIFTDKSGWMKHKLEAHA